MHHVNQPMDSTYQHGGRNQFAPASGSSGGIVPDRTAPGSGVMGLPGRGVSVVLRLSPTGVPTYYYYTQQPSTSSSPMAIPSSSSLHSGAPSPVPNSAPSSPIPAHHRQLPHLPSNPFQFQHHQQSHYGLQSPGQSSSSLHHNYNHQHPASPAVLQQSHCFVSPPATPSPPRTPPPAHQMVQSTLGTSYPPSPLSNQRQVTSPQQQPNRYPTRASAASGTSAVAIDNKIEQAMDLVKSHLMFAVREEVEVLKEKIAELMERINQLEVENTILKANASSETLAQLSGGGTGGGQAVVPPAASMQMQAQGQQQAS